MVGIQWPAFCDCVTKASHEHNSRPNCCTHGDEFELIQKPVCSRVLCVLCKLNQQTAPFHHSSIPLLPFMCFIQFLVCENGRNPFFRMSNQRKCALDESLIMRQRINDHMISSEVFVLHDYSLTK